MADLARVKQAWAEYHARFPVLERDLWHKGARLMLGGNAVAPSTMARTLGASLEAVRRHIAALAERGECTLDEQGNVTGIGGLSVVPAEHELTLNGRRLYTWCALDALAIPAAYGMDAHVRSSTVDDGLPLDLDFKEGGWSPEELWINLVEPTCCARLREGVCTEINFYRHRPPEGPVVLTVNQAAAWGKFLWE